MGREGNKNNKRRTKLKIGGEINYNIIKAPGLLKKADEVESNRTIGGSFQVLVLNLN